MLRTLALIKRYTPFNVRKQLAEALVLSKRLWKRGFRAELSVAKLAWKSVNCADWPKFLPMEFRAPIRTRGGNQEALIQIKSCVENTFGSYAPKVFNNSRSQEM